MELLHRLHVADAAIHMVALTPQHLDRPQESLLAFGRGLRCSLLGGRSQPLQHAARLIGVHLRDQGMVVRQGLAPVGHGEVGVYLLRRLELIDRLIPAEAVEDRHAPQEVLLDLPARRRGKVDGADVVELGLNRQSRGRQYARDNQWGHQRVRQRTHQPTKGYGEPYATHALHDSLLSRCPQSNCRRSPV